jgi:G6PDH family F420-dependent oxidoreductase
MMEVSAMAEIGYFLSSEEHGPRDLVRFAHMAEEAGFRAAWISDHYHPWIDRQGQSPFVWSVLGGIASTTKDLRIATAVTCPTIRTHPAVIAQAAATVACMMPGRFALGVGSGEALNEHVTDAHWPEPSVRLDMLEEAVEVMRLLWKGGVRSHYGEHYRVRGARIYTLPEEPPPVIVSAFGEQSITLAARIGDGWASTSPDADMVRTYADAGGSGVKQAGVKVCWGPDEAKARQLAHELWPTSGVPGQLSQELPMPQHFEEASSLVTEEQIAETIACGPDPEKHAQSIKQYIDAGFDEVYVSQIGPDQEGFFEFFNAEVRPRL